MKIYKIDSAGWRTIFEVAKKREKIKELEKEIQDPTLWQDKERAIQISQELNSLQKEITELENLETEIELLDNQETIREFEKKLREKEILIYLSEKYDKGDAVLSVFSGAGGQDAQDWAIILLRMYERYCQTKGFKTKILHQSFGEGGGPEGRIGIKSATLEIKGDFAYGILKKENGVHRLVRISPFSPQKLRHTSFALVEVLPHIPKPEESELEINPEDLKIDFFRASGPGGQYVNKKETAVRITHLPTGISVASQSERFQAQNREKAMELLFAKLHQTMEEQQQKEISKLKGAKVSASWGNQIRSYVLQPYQLVKDLRTGVESTNPEKVLDGELEQFIEAEIKFHD